MKLSNSTIEALAKIIIGENNRTPYKTGPQLIKFFNNHGAEDIYGSDFPSRLTYTLGKLSQFNGTEGMPKIVEDISDPLRYVDTEEFKANEVAIFLNNFLKRDGFYLSPVSIIDRSLRPEDIVDFIEFDCSNDMPEEDYFELKAIGKQTLSTQKSECLSHEFISEQIRDCKDKLTQGKYSGAITNARSLVESVIQELILRFDDKAIKFGGDLPKMYKKLSFHMNLNASSDMGQPFQQILSGFNSIIIGLAGVSNKMGDRHARMYKPSRHHAELAINTAFMLAEFLLSSYEHQEGIADEQKA